MKIVASTSWVIFVGAQIASAQVQFASVAAQRGLVHTVQYGATFSFSDALLTPPFNTSVMQAMQRNMGNGLAVGDYDNDGDDDVYFMNNVAKQKRLFRNDLVAGARVFVDVTAAMGVTDTGLGRLAHFVDLNNDGLRDLLVINDQDTTGNTAPSRIFANNGTTFTDVTGVSGFTALGYLKGGTCLGDYDDDGLIDIYVALWLLEAESGAADWPGYNRLFRNLGNFQFADVTAAVGLGQLNRDSFACAFADFDNDGDADLYVAVDHTSDAYYRNDDGIFSDQTVAVGATHTGNDMGISVEDFDNDGDLDVYSTNITDMNGYYGTTQFNTLLVNQLVETGIHTFVDEAGARGVRDTYWGWGTEWVDVDNDADLDLYAVNGFKEWISATRGPNYPLINTPEVLFINDGSGHYAVEWETGADFVGDARGAVAFDYNLDGRQDLLITNLNQPVVLLENRTLEAGNWISVRLIGACGSNADAIGGRVYVTTGSLTQMREIVAGVSYLSGRPYELHFGLGNADGAALRVVWPDGSESDFSIAELNRRYLIEKGDGESRMRHSVSLLDIARFQQCMGADVSEREECRGLDLKPDLNIDLDDAAIFLEWMTAAIPGCVVQ